MEPLPQQVSIIMLPTIKDIAERSGVGLGTVSRVLNDSPRVSVETRERVMRAIADLNYVPSSAARGLSRGKTMSIAVMAPFFTRSAFVERLQGVEAAVAESQYDLVVYNVETSEKRDRYFRSVPDPRRVDGVIIISLPPTEADLAHLDRSSVPVVFIDVSQDVCGSHDRILVDDVKGGRLATEHLISLGHRRIGFIGDIPREGFNFTAGQRRFEGYCLAHQQHGLPLDAALHRDGVFGREIATEIAAEMLRQPDPPTAIFASSDTQAMGVLEAARLAGLAVPGDLSIVGYDDIEIADYLGLTTVRQLLLESGRRGVQTLLKRMGEPLGNPVCDVLPVELIVRRTTAPPTR